MQPLFFVVAILGCGDGDSACRDARTVAAQYRSIQQCRAALPGQLARNSDLPFPVIGAECRAVGDMVAAKGGGAPKG